MPNMSITHLNFKEAPTIFTDRGNKRPSECNATLVDHTFDLDDCFTFFIFIFRTPRLIALKEETAAAAAGAAAAEAAAGAAGES